ncbi:uncharacterized protein LOC105092905 isoform X3 [Camelus dromedarius]|uniref:uncharacterized protein LOC105092905 isoform X3 n=1 Tax=Camelus dromedarius TaxID=9838 RepID=UPI00311A6586
MTIKRAEPCSCGPNIREELLFAHWWGAGLRAGIAHARLIVPSLASTLSSLASMLALYCENRVPPVFKNHAKEERRNHQPEFFSDNFLRQFPNIKFESFTHVSGRDEHLNQQTE